MSLTQNKQTHHIAIVCVEPSGDTLGAELIELLNKHNKNITFSGIAGPKMRALGCQPLARMEDLSVMGLVEVLSKLPKLLGIKRRILKHYGAQAPDLYIGIDGPDFNLGIEERLKQQGVKTLHYVSPTVWAWRPQRIHRIKRAVNHMLTLFPFEKPIYDAAGIPATFVGHPKAGQWPLDLDWRRASPPETEQSSQSSPSREELMESLGLDPRTKTVALLPGSRASELKYLAATFIKTAKHCADQDSPPIQWVTAMANGRRAQQWQGILKREAPHLTIHTVPQAEQALKIADAALLASGTITLEALFAKCPMVVSYRVSPISAVFLRRMLGGGAISLPNRLAGRALVPEILQEQATPENLGKAILNLLGSRASADQIEAFQQIHQTLLVPREALLNSVSQLLE